MSSHKVEEVLKWKKKLNYLENELKKNFIEWRNKEEEEVLEKIESEPEKFFEFMKNKKHSRATIGHS